MDKYQVARNCQGISIKDVEGEGDGFLPVLERPAYAKALAGRLTLRQAQGERETGSSVVLTTLGLLQNDTSPGI